MLRILLYFSGPSVCPPWRKWLFKSFGHFLNWAFCLPRVVSCGCFMYFEDQTQSKVSLANMFSYTVCSLFTLMLFSLVRQKLFNLMRSHLFILCFMSHALWDISVKILLHGLSVIFLSMFSSRTFMVSWLIFKSFIHLEFIVG